MKPNDERVRAAFLDVASWLSGTHPNIQIHAEQTVVNDMKRLSLRPFDAANPIDFVVTLGGDGTILHASYLFQGPVPPILSFSLGTLGFLLPFDLESYKEAIEDLIDGSASILQRTRLQSTLRRVGKSPIVSHALNEITLHRGRDPHLSTISCFVDDRFLTDVVADGLIVSSPTGSTAYSLSCGGPLVHPLVHATLITPICPRSLSFRPLVMPATSLVKLRLSEHSRGTADVSVDGEEAITVGPGDEIEIQASEFPTPCVNRSRTGSVDWTRDLNRQLRWNQTFVSKSFRHVEFDDEE
ncbi:ATP-NAD kinase-like domain-containing protein [Cladochytrium replicatum]|nr:ATP-NAD kinase-like domain-containing protein [Cladochytrium replicatum]